MASVTGCTISKAQLICRWCLPPPRLVSAALTQQVSYQTQDWLRFVAQPKQGDGLIHDSEGTEFTLNAVTFPYQPSIYIFSVAPHYAHATQYIGSRAQDSWCLENMKKDKRLTITHMDLSINTSTNAIPYDGSGGAQVVRLNARQLYNMTMENVASMLDFPYTFEQWFENMGFCVISPSQLNGIMNSPHTRGSMILQGTIYVKNYSGMPVNVSTANVHMADADAQNGVVFVNGANVPRYQCLVTGMFCNKNLVLDSKSGIINEQVYSQQFQSQLRLGSGGR